MNLIQVVVDAFEEKTQTFPIGMSKKQSSYVESSSGVGRQIVLMLDFKKSDYFVDLGSGEGKFIQTIAGLSDCNFLGVEFSNSLHLESLSINSKSPNKERIHFAEDDISNFMNHLPEFVQPSSIIIYLYLVEYQLEQSVLKKQLVDLIDGGARMITYRHRLVGLEKWEYKHDEKFGIYIYWNKQN